MPDIIKPKRATRSVADKSEKILEKDELLLISPDTGSGTGRYGIKIGDGATATKDLPYAVDSEKADDMVVSEFSVESDENPILNPGDKVKSLFGKLLKKFTYFEKLIGDKINTSDIYDGTDSSSTTKVASANSVRQVNEKADNNATQISQLNSNLEAGTATIPIGNGAMLVKYNIPFSVIPKILLTPRGSAQDVVISVKTKDISTTGFGIVAVESTSSGIKIPNYPITVDWIAIAK